MARQKRTRYVRFCGMHLPDEDPRFWEYDSLLYLRPEEDRALTKWERGGHQPSDLVGNVPLQLALLKSGYSGVA